MLLSQRLKLGKGRAEAATLVLRWAGGRRRLPLLQRWCWVEAGGGGSRPVVVGAWGDPGGGGGEPPSGGVAEGVPSRWRGGPQDLDAEAAGGDLVGRPPEWEAVSVEGNPAGFCCYPRLGLPPAGRHAILRLEQPAEGGEVGTLGPEVPGRGLGGLAVGAVGHVQGQTCGRAKEGSPVPPGWGGGGAAAPDCKEKGVGS